jgi:hypothetical protein
MCGVSCAWSTRDCGGRPDYTRYPARSAVNCNSSNWPREIANWKILEVMHDLNASGFFSGAINDLPATA